MSIKIMIDAGHNGKRNQGVNKAYYESVQMWKLHEYLKAELEKYEDVTVGVTRDNIDVYMDVSDRGKKAKGYDVMLSLHTNAVSGSSATKRVVVFKPVSGKGDALAVQLANAILNTMNLTKDKYWYCETKAQANSFGTDYYGVIRGAAAVGVPCLLLEQSFHTNKEACNWLLKDDNLKELAKAEAKTIANHYGLKAKSESTLYLVQAGAFSTEKRAQNHCAEIKEAGFDAVVVYQDGLSRVQAGAFSKLERAEARVKDLKTKGFDAIIKEKP